MAYYIEYPKSKVVSVRVVTKKPVEKIGSRWGFAEGPLKTIKAVVHRLNAMGVVNKRRPVKYREVGYG